MTTTHEATSAFYVLFTYHHLSKLWAGKTAMLVHWFHLTILSVTALSVSVICFVGAVKDSSSGTIRSSIGCMQLDIHLKALQIGKMTPASKWCLRQLLMLGMPGTGHLYPQLHHISIAVLIKVSSYDSIYLKETFYTVFNYFILFPETPL